MWYFIDWRCLLAVSSIWSWLWFYWHSLWSRGHRFWFRRHRHWLSRFSNLIPLKIILKLFNVISNISFIPKLLQFLVFFIYTKLLFKVLQFFLFFRSIVLLFLWWKYLTYFNFSFNFFSFIFFIFLNNLLTLFRII